MSVSVMVRAERGCGFRNTRGYYLCGGGMEVHCHRLPLPIPVCEACKRPLIVPIRGIQRIEPNKVWTLCPEWQDLSYPCHLVKCPSCFPPEKAYVVWVGESFYETPNSFVDESRRMGISRKIPFVPDDLKVGDWVFLGYRKLIPTENYNKDHEEILDPGIFHAFRVSTIEKLLTDAQQKDQYYVKTLLDRGITPVVEVDSEEEIEAVKARLYTNLSKFMKDEPGEQQEAAEEEVVEHVPLL